MPGKVLLVYPRFISGWMARPRVEIPMGLLSVATPVSRAGYEVQILDQRIEPQWRRVLGEALAGGLLCVGVSAMTGPQLGHALEVSRLVKEHGAVPVVWGGVHPSLLPEQTLANKYIDMVVQGEGEETFLELVQALDRRTSLQSVRGLWYKDNGHIRQTDVRPVLDLNAQPPLAFDLIEPRRYIRVMSGVEHLNFFTSRGCPHRCTFCFNTPFNKRSWRAMDADRAVERIKDFVQRHGVRGLTFTDINFFTDMERGRRILEGIVRADLKVVISKISVRIDTLAHMSAADFALLEAVGCRRITVGVESGSERIQKLLGKPIDRQQVLEVNRTLRQYPFVPVYLFMMGIPTETMADLSDSISLALQLVDQNPNATKRFSIYTPFPGTELFDVAVQHGLRVPERIEEWIPFNYRSARKNATWLNREMRKTVEMLDFCSFFIGRRSFLRPYEKLNPLVMLLCNLYAPLARWRVERLVYQWPIEVRLARWLRLYGKQG